ncbi:hypothetical protein [Aquipseudomonas alcaligenes]|uniref:Uncharacterized protein n=1 Tax=Aquipseudomonas alcaligenes TaxID=43263 RepID=A0AA42N3A3_AQUAC|nr:hypothetical protein [Pseudomonas alcaligenes]MDH1056748.1 hypothetical protein [Pseudomonas alcaligenes]
MIDKRVLQQLQAALPSATEILVGAMIDEELDEKTRLRVAREVISLNLKTMRLSGAEEKEAERLALASPQAKETLKAAPVISLHPTIAG